MKAAWATIGILFGIAGSLPAQEPTLGLARIFYSGAVLQRQRPVPIWGRAGPGARVTATFGDHEESAEADAAGAWRVVLPPMEACSDPKPLRVATSDGQEVVLEDILVGDLWLCAGQSNMEMGMAAIENRTKEMKDLKYPLLRLFQMPKSAAGRPRQTVPGVWLLSNRLDITTGGWNGFSAVAYCFGRKLQKELGVPVAVIQAAYGGSPISAWIPPSEMSAEPELAKYASQAKRADKAFAKALEADPDARHPFDDPLGAAELGPSSIYNALLSPLGGLALKGVVWYQGETDVGDGPLYTTKMEALIAGLRRAFGDEHLPFYFAQIAPWEGYDDESLPRFWAAQEAALGVPGTGMALTIDVGDFKDIHPSNKRPVGERLALQALAKTYGRSDLAADGPVFGSWSPRGSDAVVDFIRSGELSTSDGRDPQGFELEDPRGEWHPADAALVSGELVVRNPGSFPVRGVRYAWSAVPVVNLIDRSGLPARPFSSDANDKE